MTDHKDRVVLLNIGWMPRYDKVDERLGLLPMRGGSYTAKNRGHEALNFEPVDGRCYGYARAKKESGGLNLGTIDLAAKEERELAGVLVIWVALFEGRGESVVVGWYRNATVLADIVEPPPDTPRGDFKYLAHAATEDVVRLPVEERGGWPVPRGLDAFGQANVLYATEERWEDWLGELVARVRAYPQGATEADEAPGAVSPVHGHAVGPTPVGKGPREWVSPNTEGFFAKTQAGVVWRERKENEFVVWLASYLERHGAPPLHLYPIDLLIEQPLRVFFEAKREADPIPVRTAVGQLLWYSFLHRRRPRSELCVVLPESPTDQEVAFVEDDRGMLIAWRDGDRLVGGPKSAVALARVGVSPGTVRLR